MELVGEDCLYIPLYSYSIRLGGTKFHSRDSFIEGSPRQLLFRSSPYRIDVTLSDRVVPKENVIPAMNTEYIACAEATKAAVGIRNFSTTNIIQIRERRVTPHPSLTPIITPRSRDTKGSGILKAYNLRLLYS
jgi:hypothetical protein